MRPSTGSTRQRDARVVRTGTLHAPGGVVEVTGSTPPVLVGRDPSCALVLDDPEASTLHCEIRAEPEGVLLRDLGSKNGTLVGAVRVREAFLTAACVIQAGGTQIRFEPGTREHVPISPEHALGALVGTSPRMRQLFRILREVAPTELSVLVTGETGTGKELCARALHEHSPRAGGPLVVVDCATIPESLAESHLFGHEKGAFTGAVARTRGAFHEAHGGTIFLDEIGELPLDLQPKLLRVLAEKQVRRVGAVTPETVDVRVVAATLQDLGRRTNSGRFRADLFFRLAQVRIELPPLRERRADLALLTEAACARVGRPERATELVELVTKTLAQHDWPGNVRELVNLVQAAAQLPYGAESLAAILPIVQGREVVAISSPFGAAKRDAVNAFELEYFSRLIGETDGNVSEMARRSGMERHHVRAFLRKLGLVAK